MGFRTEAYATVWSVEQKFPTLTKGRISISRKNRETGEYDTDFSGFVDFVGTACADKAAKLKERDRIRLGDVDVINRYDKEKGAAFINYKIYSFSMADEAKTPARPVSDGTFPEAEAGFLFEGDVSEDNLPY